MSTSQINEHPLVTTSAVAYALTNTKSDIIAFAKAQSDFLREKIYNPIAAHFKSELGGRVIALLTSILEVPIQFIISSAIVLLFTSVVFTIHLFSQTQFKGNDVERMPEHNSEESLTIQLKDVDGEVVVSQPQLIPMTNANNLLPQSQLDAQFDAYISQDIDDDDVGVSTEVQVNELLTPLPEFLDVQLPSDFKFSFEKEEHEPVIEAAKPAKTTIEDILKLHEEFDRYLEKTAVPNKPHPKSVQKNEESDEAVKARFEQRKKLLEQAKAERELLERYNRHMNLAKNGDVDKLPFSWHAQPDFFKLHETT